VSAPRRVLVRLPTWIGDAVMVTPALRALRQAWPEARIVFEGRPVLGELLAGTPHHDEFLPDPGDGIAARRRRLRAGDFDLAVLFPDSVRVALAPFLAGIPRRVGFSRDPLRRALLSDALSPPAREGPRLWIPMIERYLGLTRHLGCPDRGDALDLAVDPAAAARVAADLAARGVPPDEALLIVTPGAGFGPSKQWPPEHFAAACDGIADRLGLRPILAPAPGEEAIAREIAARARGPVLARVDPPGDIAELKALVARARLLLTNDTGPRQIAAALATPAVVLIGPTESRLAATHLERQRVLREPVPCGPCHLKRCPLDHRCLTRLAPERAVAAAARLLEARAGGSAPAAAR